MAIAMRNNIHPIDANPSTRPVIPSATKPSLIALENHLSMRAQMRQLVESRNLRALSVMGMDERPIQVASS
jgi:hypothetical protein